MKVHILHIRHILIVGLLSTRFPHTFRLHRLSISLRLLYSHDTNILDLADPSRGDPAQLLFLVEALEVGSHEERREA